MPGRGIKNPRKRHTEPGGMAMKRTDLALEAHEICRRAKRNEDLPGVRTETKRRGEIRTTVVQVLDAEGERALGKAAGTYVSMELCSRQASVRSGAADQLTEHLRRLLPEDGAVTVVGLGNQAITPDALGACTVRELLVTGTQLPFLRPVTAFCPGVRGQTGIESLELVQALVERIRPACVIAVDALAAAKIERIGAVIQLSDAGIQPGSGVGCRHAQLSEKTLGVPVLALGVPTVTDLEGEGSGRIVTTADVDVTVAAMAKLLGSAINRALHPTLSKAELDEFLS